ncbi:MAG: hypothetical protein HOH43_15430, partial [Candidatus Latescibacteria bacterium]|nr:hypothetical protein [Candidatus Latescibacterota bacterium]
MEKKDIRTRSPGAESVNSGRNLIGVILLGLLLEAACIEIVRIGDLRTSLTPVAISGIPITLLVFWLPFFAAFIVYIVGILRTSRQESRSDTSVRPAIDRVTWGILLFAMVFRFTLLLSPATLSDDIYRYVWDGSVQNHGINPYLHPPEALETSVYRDGYWTGVNNKHIPTIYPPLLQLAFRTVDAIAHTPLAMKFFFMMCDLGIIVVLLQMLRLRRVATSRILIYAWNPLVLVEITGSGHNDSLALLLLLLSILFMIRDRQVFSIVWLALSFVAKFFSVVLIPSFYLQVRRIAPFLAFPAVITLFYMFYIDAGMDLFQGLMVYSDKWRFNDSIFTAVLEMTGSLTGAKIVIGSIFAVVVLGRLLGGTDHIRTAYILIGAYLLLTPTLQVWYLVWIVPFLCFYPNRAWILLTGLAMLSYNVLVQFV